MWYDTTMANPFRVLCRFLVIAACLLILAPSVPGVAQEQRDEERIIKTDARDIEYMVFSPDGNLLACMSQDHVIILSVRKLHHVRTLTLPCGVPRMIVWSPDSRYLATNSTGGFGRVRDEVMVWRTDTWQPVAFYPTQGYLNGFAFVTGKPELVVMANDCTTVLWDFARNKTLRRAVWPNREAGYHIPWVCKYMRSDWMDSYGDLSRYPVSPLDGITASRRDDQTIVLTPSSQKVSPIPVHPILPWLPPITTLRGGPQEKVGPWDSVPVTPAAPITPAEIAAAAPDRIAEHDSGIVHKVALAHAAPPNNHDAGGDIVVQSSDGQSVKTRAYHVPDDPCRLSFSPNGKYLVYMMGPEPVDAITYRYRVLDLASARLSSYATEGSYVERIAWSPDSRYLSLYDDGQAWARYYTLQVLLCWDFKRNRTQAVVSAWNIEDNWTSAGRLRFHVEHGGKGEFDPATGIITLL